MKTISSTFTRSLAVFACIVLLSACSNMNTTQQRTLSGAGIGAGVGAASAAVTGGCISCGGVIGGAVGAGSGYIYDKTRKK